MWFLLGLVVGSSIRIAPSSGPCSLEEIGTGSWPPAWLTMAFIVAFGAVFLLRSNDLFGVLSASHAAARQYREMARRFEEQARKAPSDTSK